MRVFKLGVWFLITLAVLSLAVALIGQNTEPISVTLFTYTTQAYPKWAVLLASGFLGAAATTLFFLVELIVLETKNIRLRRSLRHYERALKAQGNSAALAPTDPSTSSSTESKYISDAEDDLSDV